MNKLLTGTFGIGAVQVITEIPTQDIQQGTTIIIQIIIGIITIVKLLTKSKNK